MVSLTLVAKVMPLEPDSESESEQQAGQSKPINFFFRIHKPEDRTLRDLHDDIQKRWAKMMPNAGPLQVKKLLNDALDQVNLDPDMTVADIFVDHGKAEADGLDQHACVRVIQEPADRSVRYGSVVHDWNPPAHSCFDEALPQTPESVYSETAMVRKSSSTLIDRLSIPSNGVKRRRSHLHDSPADDLEQERSDRVSHPPKRSNTSSLSGMLPTSQSDNSLHNPPNHAQSSVAPAPPPESRGPRSSINGMENVSTEVASQSSQEPTPRAQSPPKPTESLSAERSPSPTQEDSMEMNLQPQPEPRAAPRPLPRAFDPDYADPIIGYVSPMAGKTIRMRKEAPPTSDPPVTAKRQATIRDYLNKPAWARDADAESSDGGPKKGQMGLGITASPPKRKARGRKPAATETTESPSSLSRPSRGRGRGLVLPSRDVEPFPVSGSSQSPSPPDKSTTNGAAQKNAATSGNEETPSKKTAVLLRSSPRFKSKALDQAEWMSGLQYPDEWEQKVAMAKKQGRGVAEIRRMEDMVRLTGELITAIQDGSNPTARRLRTQIDNNQRQLDLMPQLVGRAKKAIADVLPPSSQLTKSGPAPPSVVIYSSPPKPVQATRSQVKNPTATPNLQSGPASGVKSTAEGSSGKAAGPPATQTPQTEADLPTATSGNGLPTTPKNRKKSQLLPSSTVARSKSGSQSRSDTDEESEIEHRFGNLPFTPDSESRREMALKCEPQTDSDGEANPGARSGRGSELIGSSPQLAITLFSSPEPDLESNALSLQSSHDSEQSSDDDLGSESAKSNFETNVSKKPEAGALRRSSASSSSFSSEESGSESEYDSEVAKSNTGSVVELESVPKSTPGQQATGNTGPVTRRRASMNGTKPAAPLTQQTGQPSGQVQTQQPNGQGAKKQPVQPAAKKQAAKPAEKKQATKPAEKKQATKPAEKKQATKPAEKKQPQGAKKQPPKPTQLTTTPSRLSSSTSGAMRDAPLPKTTALNQLPNGTSFNLKARPSLATLKQLKEQFIKNGRGSSERSF